jgi:hypothetical protein
LVSPISTKDFAFYAALVGGCGSPPMPVVLASCQADYITEQMIAALGNPSIV